MTESPETPGAASETGGDARESTGEEEEEGGGGREGKRKKKEGDDIMTVLRMMRAESINSVRMLVKLFELQATMSEGRKTRIFLFDERHLDIFVQPKLRSAELLDLVASHWNLKEKNYFGLTFSGDNGHNRWLELNRKVLDHDFPKLPGPLTLSLAIRFYVESISDLRDNSTVEIFYLQARQAIFNGSLACDPCTVFELAAYALQEKHGDFTDVSTAREHLKNLSVLPTATLTEHPCLSYCEDQVIARYRKLCGLGKGACIVDTKIQKYFVRIHPAESDALTFCDIFSIILVGYMAVVEDLPTYGIHYFSVKDKSGIPWYLGISVVGIKQYDHNDKKVPRRVFGWKQLENLYYRDRKFSIEVIDPKRCYRGSLSRRPSFGRRSATDLHIWYTASPQLSKSLWTMTIEQHQFFLQRRQPATPSLRSRRDIATELSNSSISLSCAGGRGHGGGSGGGVLWGGGSDSLRSDSFCRQGSTSSLPSVIIGSTPDLRSLREPDPSLLIKKNLYADLKIRKDQIEKKLSEKLQQLDQLSKHLTGAVATADHATNYSGSSSQPAAGHQRLAQQLHGSMAAAPAAARPRTLFHSARPSCLELSEGDLKLQERIAANYLKLTRMSEMTNRKESQFWQQRYTKAWTKLKEKEILLTNETLRCRSADCSASLIAADSAVTSPPGISAFFTPRPRRRTPNSNAVRFATSPTSDDELSVFSRPSHTSRIFDDDYDERLCMSTINSSSEDLVDTSSTINPCYDVVNPYHHIPGTPGIPGTPDSPRTPGTPDIHILCVGQHFHSKSRSLPLRGKAVVNSERESSPTKELYYDQSTSPIQLGTAETVSTNDNIYNIHSAVYNKSSKNYNDHDDVDDNNYNIRSPVYNNFNSKLPNASLFSTNIVSSITSSPTELTPSTHNSPFTNTNTHMSSPTISIPSPSFNPTSSSSDSSLSPFSYHPHPLNPLSSVVSQLTGIPSPPSLLHTCPSTIPAHISLIPSHFSLIPCPSSTIPSHFSTIPSPSSTIPSPSATTPSLSSNNEYNLRSPHCQYKSNSNNLSPGLGSEPCAQDVIRERLASALLRAAGLSVEEPEHGDRKVLGNSSKNRQGDHKPRIYTVQGGQAL